jgi:hypothetical protein
LVCFIFFYICATQIIVLGIYIFYLPLVKSVAKKTVLRYKNVVGALSPLTFAPPPHVTRYATAHSGILHMTFP